MNEQGAPQDYAYLQIPLDLRSFATKKDVVAKYYAKYFLARCMSMFSYKNLPETIPHEVFDRLTMVNGISCITKGTDGKLYVFGGNLGGVQDVYYRPTMFIISNPHLKDGFYKDCIVLGDEPHDGVLMRNDTEWLGLMPMIGRYSYLLAENTITLRMADVNLRILALLTAPTDKEKVAAEEYLRKIDNGEMGVISQQPFFDGVKMQNPPSNNGSYLTQFIELHQYLTGSFYNEIGLLANYNMKREAIGTGETTLNQDMLLPLCENMLKCRREDMNRVNEMFGTNIEVDFSSSWLHNEVEQTLQTISTVSQLMPAGGGQFGSGMSQPETGMDQPETGMDQPETGMDQVEDKEDNEGTEESVVEEENVEVADVAENGAADDLHEQLLEIATKSVEKLISDDNDDDEVSGDEQTEGQEEDQREI